MTIERRYRWVRSNEGVSGIWLWFHRGTQLVDLMEACLRDLEREGVISR